MDGRPRDPARGGFVGPLLAEFYLDPLDHPSPARGSRSCATPTTSSCFVAPPRKPTWPWRMVRRWASDPANSSTRRKPASRGPSAVRRLRLPRLPLCALVSAAAGQSLRKLEERGTVGPDGPTRTAVAVILADLNRSLLGWYAYFGHGTPGSFDDSMPRYGDASVVCCVIGAGFRLAGDVADHLRSAGSLLRARSCSRCARPMRLIRRSSCR